MRALLFLPFITFGLVPAAGFSQEIAARGDENQIGGSKYYIGKEPELLMSVSILGSVSKPGQYKVSSETDLISLIAHAGGCTGDANINEVRIMRRNGDREKLNVVKINLEKYYASGDQRQTPLLVPEDTVIIPNRKSVPMKTMVDIARGAAYVAQVAYIFFLMSRE
ncbi:MAG: polysaccharide biosynthesis/export family protein [bacterium]